MPKIPLFIYRSSKMSLTWRGEFCDSTIFTHICKFRTCAGTPWNNFGVWRGGREDGGERWQKENLKEEDCRRKKAAGESRCTCTQTYLNKVYKAFGASSYPSGRKTHHQSIYSSISP
jgi:hypothetical protein